MATRVRQSVIVEPGLLELRSAKLGKPGPHDLVVAPDAVGVCGTDLELFDGRMAYFSSGIASYPIVPGHEWTGVIVELGELVDGFALGDRVVGECSIGCGVCRRCNVGMYHLCPSRTETGIAGRSGALATRMVFPSAAAHRMPDTVSADDAVFVEPLAVACRALARLDLEPVDSLAVVGAGTLGLLCAMTARAWGVDDVRLVEVDPERRRFASEMGFALAERVERATRVVEASGSRDGVMAAVDMCEDGGVVVALGLTGLQETVMNIDDVVVRDLTIRGSLGSPGVWPEAVDLIGSQVLRPSRLISHEFALDHVGAAFELAARRRGEVRKVVVRPN